MRIHSLIGLSVVAAVLSLGAVGAAQAYEVRADGTVCIPRADGNCDVVQATEVAPVESSVVIATPGYVRIERSYGSADGISCDDGRRIAKRHLRHKGFHDISAVSCDGPEFTYFASGSHGSGAYVKVNQDGEVVAVNYVIY
jgi:hypothetical protein